MKRIKFSGSFNLKSYFTFLSRNKAYTAVNVFGLAVSLMFVIIIGLYTWQETSVNRQHANADRIYNIGLQAGDSTLTANCHHIALRYLRDRFPEVELTCGFTTEKMKLKDNDAFVNIDVMEADSTFFSMFDFPLLYGDRHTCLAQKGNIVLTESFARRLFGTSNAVGRDITAADNSHFRVSGVVKDFDNTIIDKDIDAIIDFSFCTNMANKDEYFRQVANYLQASVFVRVHEGSDFEAKQKDVEKMFSELNPNMYPVITRLDRLYFSGLSAYAGLRLGNLTLVRVLFAMGLVILLFSIMNYINLTVAQAGYRAREMATRRLFGCNKGKISVNMFTESLVMCIVSLLFAVSLACACAPYADRLLDTRIDLALLLTPSSIGMIAAFILAVSFMAGVLPATILSRVKPIEVVRGTFRKQTKMLFSRVFITVQNVITIVMLACAFIMARQMSHLTTAPLGFNTENIISLNLNYSSDRDPSGQFSDRLRALPFVKAVALSNGTPANGGNDPSVQFEGDKDPSTFNTMSGTPEMMNIYGIKVKKDFNVHGDSIVYLNDKALYYLKMEPNSAKTSDRFGLMSLLFGGNPRYGGIINDFKVRDIRQDIKGLIVLVCNKIIQPRNISILVEGDPMEAYAKIKEIYKEVYREDVDESTPPFIDKQIEQRFEQEMRVSKIVSLFAFIAIVISLLGLVAMSTYFIQQRAKEIAIRKVFGSTGNQIRARLIRSFLLYVGIAFVIAVPIIAHFMGDWISQYSYRITWWPWIVMAGVIVLVISFAAVAVQSWIASNENPVKNIKQE